MSPPLCFAGALIVEAVLTSMPGAIAATPSHPAERPDKESSATAICGAVVAPQNFAVEALRCRFTRRAMEGLARTRQSISLAVCLSSREICQDTRDCTQSAMVMATFEEVTNII